MVAIAPKGTYWWIKGDACDVVSGLGESVKGEWSGNIDLNDGKLKSLYDQYCDRKKVCRFVRLPKPS